MKYPDFARVLEAPVHNKELIVGNLTIRDLLEVEISVTKGKTIQYICLNPSKATMNESDFTVNKLLNFTLYLAKEEDSVIADTGKVFISNVFPYYSTTSEKLYDVLEYLIRENCELFSKWQIRNLNIIKKIVNVSDYIVLSWGEPPSSSTHTEFSSTVSRYHRWYTSKIIEYIHKIKKKELFILLTDGNSVLTKTLQPRHPSRRQQKLIGLKACHLQSYYTIEY